MNQPYVSNENFASSIERYYVSVNSLIDNNRTRAKSTKKSLVERLQHQSQDLRTHNAKQFQVQNIRYRILKDGVEALQISPIKSSIFQAILTEDSHSVFHITIREFNKIATAKNRIRLLPRTIFAGTVNLENNAFQYTQPKNGSAMPFQITLFSADLLLKKLFDPPNRVKTFSPPPDRIPR